MPTTSATAATQQDLEQVVVTSVTDPVSAAVGVPTPPASGDTIPAGQHVSLMDTPGHHGEFSCWGHVKQGWRRQLPASRHKQVTEGIHAKALQHLSSANGSNPSRDGPNQTGSNLTDVSAATSTALKAARPPQPARPSSARAVWNGVKGVCHSSFAAIKSTLHMYRIAPSCWLVPLLLLMLMLGLGIWGVEQGASAETAHMRDVAIAAADGVAKSFELQLQQTYAPCVTLALMVQIEPQWPQLRELFLHVAPSLMAQVPSDSLLEIQFAPQGIITDSYPADPAAEGQDLFTVQNRRAIAIETVQQGTLTVAGPLVLFRGGLGLMARIPIFLDNQTAGETYGMPHTTTDCDICYDPVTGRKFWGFSIAIITWSKVVGPSSQLAQLTNLEYAWILRQANPDNPSQLMDISRSPKPPPDTDDFVRTLINVRPPNLQANHSASFTDHWYLDTVPASGWTPAWKPAALAGVVIGAFVIAILVSAVMVNRMHQALAVQDLKEANVCLADTTQNLKEEKERLDALLERQYGLIAMFEKDSSRTADRKSGESVTMERIEAMRRSMAVGGGAPASGPQMLQLQVLELLGEGTFGKVYKGLWRGTKVAIKTLILPANMSGTEKREKMAIMEAAISSSLSHPNIVQTYTYAVRPLQDTMSSEPTSNLIITTASSTQAATMRPLLQLEGDATGVQTATAQEVINSPAAATPPSAHGLGPGRDSAPGCTSPATPTTRAASANGSAAHAAGGDAQGVQQLQAKEGTGLNKKASNVHSYEVRLVLEYCDKGTLRDAVEQGAFFTRTGLNYLAILDTALDIAQAMLHLHTLDILHGDLKARNILLKSCGDEARGVIAKVGDFGLSMKIDQHATHISSVFQGTMTHMAPEVMLHGHVSKAADVYAFGITLFELFTGSKPFHGVPGALLGHMITSEKRRPAFPPMTPPEFKALAEHCWDPQPSARPSFEEIAAELSRMRAEKSGATAPLVIKVTPPSPLQPVPEAMAVGPPVVGAGGGGGGEGDGGRGMPAIITSSVTATLTRAGKQQVRWLETLPEVPAAAAAAAASPGTSSSQLARIAIINASNHHPSTTPLAASSLNPSTLSAGGMITATGAAAAAASTSSGSLLTASGRGSVRRLSGPGQLITPPFAGVISSGGPPSRSSSTNLPQLSNHSLPLARGSGSDTSSSRRASGSTSTPQRSGHLTPPRMRDSPGAGDGSGGSRMQIGYVAQSSLEADTPALIIGEMDSWPDGCSGSSLGECGGRPVGTMGLNTNVVAQIGKLVAHKPLPRIDEGSVGRTSSEVNSYESRLIEQATLSTANISHHRSSGGSQAKDSNGGSS